MPRIGSPGTTLNVQRQLDLANGEVVSRQGRLASGLRIQSAADDPAGLAVSLGLNLRARVYGQSIRNVNESINLLGVAEGAVGQLQNLVTRLRELSTQAANGTYGRAQQRALDREAGALGTEFNRIVASTAYNGINLLRDGQEAIRVQAGETNDPMAITIATAALNVGGLGDGTFQAPVSHAGGNGPADVVIADVNRDGISDLVSAARFGNTVTINIGNGDGTFKAPSLFETGDRPLNLKVADLNGDGLLDVVTPSENDDKINVLIGNGDGTFRARRSYDTADRPQVVDLVDLNGDSLPDILSTAITDNTINVFLNQGNGTFSSRISYLALGSPRSVTASDLNRDGRPDLIAVTQNRTLAVSIGNGDGSFKAATSYASDLAGLLFDTVVTDINRDGYQDLLAPMSNDDVLDVFLGNGDGSFKAARTYYVGDDPRSIAQGDFNEDGFDDIASVNLTENTISLLLGNGDGTFKSRTSYATATPSLGIEAGDLDSDGIADLVVTGTRLGIYKGSGSMSSYLEKVDISSRDNARVTMRYLVRTEEIDLPPPC